MQVRFQFLFRTRCAGTAPVGPVGWGGLSWDLISAWQEALALELSVAFYLAGARRFTAFFIHFVTSWASVSGNDAFCHFLPSPQVPCDGFRKNEVCILPDGKHRPRVQRVMESFRLEKPSENIKSDCYPSAAKATCKTCSQLPQSCVFQIPPGMGTPEQLCLCLTIPLRWYINKIYQYPIYRCVYI